MSDTVRYYVTRTEDVAQPQWEAEQRAYRNSVYLSSLLVLESYS